MMAASMQYYIRPIFFLNINLLCYVVKCIYVFVIII